jgi:hypothetical protein
MGSSFGASARRRCAALAVATATLCSARARAGDEFHAYGIEVFGANDDGCKGKDLEHARNQAIGYHHLFVDWDTAGDWDQSLYFSDNEVDGRDFTDYYGQGTCEDWQTTCTLAEEDEVDDYGVDAADIAFLSTHGGYVGADNAFKWTMGDNDDDCSVTTNAGTKHGNMIWDDDLEILIVDACNSARFPIWDQSYDEPRVGITTMLEPTSTLSTLLGYHGSAPDRDWGAEYAEDAYYNGVGENWVLEGTDFDSIREEEGEPKVDTCATAIVFGDSADDRDFMFEWGGMGDRKDTGDPTIGSTYYYIEGCDPANATPID